MIIMASRFYQCICGKFATIDMIGWLSGYRWIHCQCGRKLNADEGLFGFTLATAHFVWRNYMKDEAIKCQEQKIT